MIAVICFTVCVGAVLSALLFQGSWIFCIAAAVVSLAMLVVQCFLFKNSRLKGILMPMLTAALLIGCMFIPSRAADYGYFDHMKQLESLTSYLENEKSDKAAEKRTEIEEKYGEDDSLRYALAVDAIFKGNISDAETIVDSFSSRESAVYYLLWEEIIAAKYASNEELVKNLEPLYIEAADKYPEWEYMNKNAGCFLFDEREYAKACYYLTNAYVYADEPDGEVMYSNFPHPNTRYPPIKS